MSGSRPRLLTFWPSSGTRRGTSCRTPSTGSARSPTSCASWCVPPVERLERELVAMPTRYLAGGDGGG
ncbi:hypothetical protein [Pseudonocardia endophytica]|uniref:hypothetical protein n=1 Tax=Pseudonocardia endophytica TaxID=401976 RepID=UPI00140550BF|nr:hypothetical protein [Pseudonocardia endophytica]